MSDSQESDEGPLPEHYILSDEQSNMFHLLEPLTQANSHPPPSEHCRLLAKEWRDSFTAPRITIERQIDDLHKELKVLEKRRRNMQTLKTRYDGPFSAIHRFPSELLVMIFIAVASRSVRGYDTSRPRTIAPWRLGQVCARWRAISVTHSSLWRAQPLSIVMYDMMKLQDPTAVLRLLLDRIGPHGHVSFTLYAHAGVKRGPTWRVMAVLTSVARRWRDVSFLDLHPRLLVLLRGNNEACSVKRLHIEMEDGCVVENGTRLDMFETALRIRHVQLQGLRFSALNLPYQNLRTVEDDTPYSAPECVERALSILRACPNLEELEIHGSPDNDVSSSNYDNYRAVFSRLQRLTTSDLDVLQALELPGLRELSVSAPEHMNIDAVPYITALLIASECDLEDLHLRDVDLDVDISSFLRLVPNIRRLHLASNDKWGQRPFHFHGVSPLHTLMVLLSRIFRIPHQSSSSSRRLLFSSSYSLSDFDSDTDTSSDEDSDTSADSIDATYDDPTSMYRPIIYPILNTFRSGHTFAFLPKLEKLLVSDCAYDEYLDYVDGEFVWMLFSRFRVYGGGLKEVDIEYAEDNYESGPMVRLCRFDSASLERLKKSGLKLNINSM